MEQKAVGAQVLVPELSYTILKGDYRLDLLVDQKIVIELKAVSALNDLFKRQILSYLKAGDYHLGLLINFGLKRLESDRIVH